MGLEVGECPEAWCLTHRDAVFSIAKAYADAGADLIKTNSFGSSRIKLGYYGLADDTVRINKAAAEISRQAAGPDRHVIASVGSTGIILMMGEVSEDEVFNAFREQICALEQGGADAVCIETMSAIDEALLAVRAARHHTSLEVICTFTFEKTQQGEYRTMMGVSPADMAVALTAAGADIIGANCGNGIAGMVEIVREIRAADQQIPILVHANAGLPIVQGDRTMFPETPEQMAAAVPDLIRAGANIIGGCCGTTPLHVAAMKRAIMVRP
jgi:5-methyltetrahydrofolate--homocysteine methyltransferase